MRANRIRVASTCLAGLGLAVAGSAVASAEPTASITAFTAKTAPVPNYEGGGSWPNTGDCPGCGFAVELSYGLAGEGYGATPKDPKGGIPPISGINVYLPAGVTPQPAGFGTCTEATLKNVGPSGCPKSSIVSPIGYALDEVTFGTSREPEEATLQTFFASGGGLLFFTHGSSPVNLEIIANGQYVPSSAPFGDELVWRWPAAASVPGAPLASTSSLRDTLGAATMTGGVVSPYLTLPLECVGGLPFKTEVTFGGEEGGEREFGIPAQTVTATYTAPCPFPPRHTLTVTLAGGGSGSVSGSGISCPGTCSALYAPGTTVTLSARPAAGSKLTGWSGACSGAGACVVTMNSDESARATFTTIAPDLSALSESYSIFAVGRSSTPLSGRTAGRRHHIGTSFSFTLDRRATVKIAIQASARGRRVGRSCRPETHRLRRRPRCARTTTIATLTRVAHPGVNRVAFSGRIGGRALRPGRYTATFAAIGEGATSPRQSLGFVIVRR